MNTLNQKASQAIASLGVVVESEKWWDTNRNKLVKQAKRYKHTHHFDEGGGEVFGRSYTKNTPAPNLQELLTASPAIGEKLGWKEMCTDCATSFTQSIIDCGVYKGAVVYNCGCGADVDPYKEEGYVVQTHRLTDIYLQDGMEGVSDEIIRLIGNK